MSGRYPLRPGRPRIYRRTPGAWAYECHCAPHGIRGQLGVGMPNLDSHQEAVSAALRHIDFWHVDPLERLFQLPPYDRATEGSR